MVNNTFLGLRQTRGRDKVLQILQKESAPVDVVHIISHLENEKINLNQATVYRILEAFSKNGIIKRFEFLEGKFRYEVDKGDHHHFICKICNLVEDISDCNIKEWEEELEKEKGFLVKNHSLEFFGVCQKCQS